MSKPKADKMRELMDKKDNVRNVVVIGDLDHGKTTLVDQILAKAGVISNEKAGSARILDARKDEQDRGITIKARSIAMSYKIPKSDLPDKNDDNNTKIEDQDEILINLFDTPGHEDFSGETASALRLTDGALLVVDCLSGDSVYMEKILKQVITERVHPILFISKLDRAILTLQLEQEELYQLCNKIVETFKVITDTFLDDKLSDSMKRDPTDGAVAFGSGHHGWAFTVKQFANLYSSKFNLEVDKLMEKLWGENYFNSKTGKWSNSKSPDNQRSFCAFILDPIYQILNAIMNSKKEELDKLLDKCDIRSKLNPKDLEQKGKTLARSVMRAWLPAGDSVLKMLAIHLPSPITAQKYRAEVLFDGPTDAPGYEAITDCDPAGPLIMYISKMVESSVHGEQFYAFGRVFSGTVAAGQKCTFQGPRASAGLRESSVNGTVQGTVLMMGRTVEKVADVPAGHICGLVGVDEFLLKSGTVTTLKSNHDIREIRFITSPVMKVAVEPTNATELPELVQGLKKLSKSDPMVLCDMEESGKHTIAGVGELHLEICLRDLREHFAKISVKTSKQFVAYRETIKKASSEMCMKKTPNKHSRLFMKAAPISNSLADDIDNGLVNVREDNAARESYLVGQHGFDISETRKIWSFGPDNAGPNILVDCTKNINKPLNEVKDFVVTGFQWATNKGVLCDESMRGVRIDIHDATVHVDPFRRGAGQIIPTARRCCYACVLTACPRLLEPVSLVNILLPQVTTGGIYSVLNQRRGTIIEEVPILGTPMIRIKAHVPTSETIGLAKELRETTSGQALTQCIFDHWKTFAGGDPLQSGTDANTICLRVRKRKGLSQDMPELREFLDKL